MSLKIKQLEYEFFNQNVVTWYKINKRDLPWRHTKDPYKIWLSEILLQQTRVYQGLPYYERFVKLFPDIKSLAKAEEQEILNLWQGLGYYSRARNLHKCARELVEKYDGKFPSKFNKLLHLPGIGAYTAAAVSSFAFKENVPVVDGNVTRVLSRFFGLDYDLSDSKSFKKFFELSQMLIDSTNPDTYNQAIMEFGALQCKPASPDCNNCPLAAKCYAFYHNAQSKLPVKTKKAKVKTLFLDYAVIYDEKEIILSKRGEDSIWRNMYDFPHLESETNLETESQIIAFQRLFGIDTTEINITEPIKHLLSHRKIFARFFSFKVECVKKIKLENSSLNVYSFDDLHNFPKPILIENYLQHTFF